MSDDVFAEPLTVVVKATPTTSMGCFLTVSEVDADEYKHGREIPERNLYDDVYPRVEDDVYPKIRDRYELDEFDVPKELCYVTFHPGQPEPVVEWPLSDDVTGVYWSTMPEGNWRVVLPCWKATEDNLAPRTLREFDGVPEPEPGLYLSNTPSDLRGRVLKEVLETVGDVVESVAPNDKLRGFHYWGGESPKLHIHSLSVRKVISTSDQTVAPFRKVQRRRPTWEARYGDTPDVPWNIIEKYLVQHP